MLGIRMRRKEAACDRSRFEQLLGQSLLLTERLAVRVDIFSPPRNLSTDILNNDSTILLTSFFGRAKSFATASIN